MQKGSSSITVLVSVVIVIIIALALYFGFYAGKQDTTEGIKIELGGSSN
jgi:hypothetical protein